MHSIKENVIRYGYAFVDRYCPGTDTFVVASALGQLLTPWDGGVVQDLVPRTSATPNTYSGIYGLDRFPFHTDLAHWRLPPRYVLLRCITGYTDVPTLLLDGQTIFDIVTLDILTRAIFTQRRPRDGSLTLLRLCEPTDGDGYCFRWDGVFLKPASRIGELADQRIREQLLNCSPLSIALARAGDILLIDNWRMLHARSPIPAERVDRKIQRIYLGYLH
ncbi:TauD/TfdA family dioxygenase [Collimonas sp. OK412]|uniref:TauD/TfdA family dioxygenase n=1 Tax=Collimonas sp. (strain OK412) TaxID=1801619 RepID=UPI0008DF6D59|nr:TauD/TfdA family dioxygenase [Collimonas sp. OK412]SFD28953.1 Taurine catabolism dioxygenase TauD, TfdA family [Collimonas sp. OK412]